MFWGEKQGFQLDNWTVGQLDSWAVGSRQLAVNNSIITIEQLNN